MALKRAVFERFFAPISLSTFTTDPSGELDVFGHDGDPLGVDSAQVGIFEKTNKVSFRSLLESHNGRALEPQVGLEILSNLPDQSLEGKFLDEEFGGSTDLLYLLILQRVTVPG